MRGGLLGTKLITLCEMNQKLNQSVSLRAVGWLLRQQGGCNPSIHSPPSLTYIFFFFYFFRFLSFLIFNSHPPHALCLFSPSPLRSLRLSSSLRFPYPFPSSVPSCSPRPARAPPPRKQRHNQILHPPSLPVHRGHAVKMTLFITVHKQRLPRRPREISHKLWSNRR